MRKRRLLLTFSVFACCLFLLLLSGCLPWNKLAEQLKPDDGFTTTDVEEDTEPERVDEIESDSEIERDLEKAAETEETTELKEPYHYHEFGLESLGLNKNMSPEEVTAILGDPLSIDTHEGMGPHTTFNYDGLSLSFELGLQHYKLQNPDIPGVRGIRVGDPAEIVLNRYLKENEVPNVWTNPEAENWQDLSNRCVELYYFEPDDEGLVKTGIIYCDEVTGTPVRITYSHYLPNSCAYSGITFFIDNNVVKEISRGGF